MTHLDAPDKTPGGPTATGSVPPPTYLPPRLREKMLAAEGSTGEWSPKLASPLPVFFASILTLGLAAGGFTWWRSTVRRPTGPDATVAPAESLATVARAESLALAARADSAARNAPDSVSHQPSGKMAGASSIKPAPTGTGVIAVTVPGTRSKSAAPSDADAATLSAAVAVEGYGIAVGTFMLEDRANRERDQLSSATGLPGIVAPTIDGGTTVYRVILGKFPSRALAEKMATALMDSSRVREAQVVARSKSG